MSRHSFGLVLFVSATSIFGAATEKDFVHHPAPKDPTYLKASSYEQFKKQISVPPSPQSTLQEQDEQALLDFQKTRTTADCQQAKAEVFVSLRSFYGAPRGSLSASEVEKLTPLFDKIRNDGDYFIQRLKKDFPRQRPFAYLKAISPCIPKEVTGAYPSGHATLAKLYASVLGTVFPERKDSFEKRALEIGKHRVLSGMHHPTDIEAGRQLADLIFQRLNESPSYRAELATHITH